jgi:hypothetical protein
MTLMKAREVREVVKRSKMFASEHFKYKSVFHKFVMHFLITESVCERDPSKGE